MRLTSDTKKKLRLMAATELMNALENQDEHLCVTLTLEQRLDMAVDEAYSAFVATKIENLVKRAHLRYPKADLRMLDLSDERNLDQQLIARLGTCGFIERCKNAVLQGFTGVGKTYLACALDKQACRNQLRTCYIRIPDLEEAWQQAKLVPGGEYKFIKKYSSFTLLILDEWLLEKPSKEFQGVLLEIMERRYNEASTIFCTQYQKKDWHARLGGAVHADAIMDRIIHNTIWVNMGEFNMREKTNSLER